MVSPGSSTICCKARADSHLVSQAMENKTFYWDGLIKVTRAPFRFGAPKIDIVQTGQCEK